MLQRFATNTAGTDYVVGDIHGCYDLLVRELKRAGFDYQRDRLFCVGDLIDRGPSSLECLQLPFEPWFHSVRGNHELLAHDAFELGRWGMWLLNGGVWVRDEDPQEVRERLREALPHMPYAFEIEVEGARVGIVHAEPPTDWSMIVPGDDALEHHLVWSRRRIERRDTSRVTGIDGVVVGHTILREPLWLGNVYYIDTGAFTTGRLTLIRLVDVIRMIGE
ncbi:serine/threonine protein phosphatase [Litchfieldella anticariensis FP35 = DSM 16096]|uniref:Serine/threonine protein phosphatase n=1 Tax=Litchfieldella anticariensis (strain DSM 16096 / CECT 5854 / CIP 108499 / LMG 22089 / FP35) TaxID=1121939 RepID=S2LGC5_LITA3|nr:metallophosphoesterase [Halomonas anticariensis]EPC03721.1 serine/threonine protein phosphatase [Halomonas anticariensis FP35 = DSM 16096]